MLKVRCQEYLDEVREFAKREGIEDKLNEALDYAANYAGADKENFLTRDFAPHSFIVQTQIGITMGMIYWEREKDWSFHS